jgi:hypothetical protein
MGLDIKTYWLTDCQSQCDFDFDLTRVEDTEILPNFKAPDDGRVGQNM